MPELTGLDWIALTVLMASLLLGAWRGLVYELLSVLTWVAAFFVAQWWALEAARYLPMGGASEPIRYAAGFVVVFVVAIFAGGLVAWLVKKLMEVAGLRPADRALGAIFGVIRGVLLLLLATLLVRMTPLKDHIWWRQSVSVGLATQVLGVLQPVMPASFGRYVR